MNKEQILELAKEVKAIYRGYRDNVTFSFTGNQLEKFAELLQQKQSDRIAELEASIKSVEADKARLLEMLKYSESAMRRCDDQFRNAKYAVLWFAAADDCLSDANWFKDVIAEMESKS